MSVIKTKCPNLSDLAKVLGPIDGVGSKKPSKPLCENIFDVQRSELFEVLESLRNSFWNDQVITETSVQQPQFEPSQEPPMSPSKRTRDSDEEDFLSENESSSRPSNLKKRARMSTPEEPTATKLPPSKNKATAKQSPLPTTRSLNAYKSLWPIKQTFIRQIKNPICRDLVVISALKEFYQTTPNDQCLHMTCYLMPVAQAMRRQEVINFLKKWL